MSKNEKIPANRRWLGGLAMVVVLLALALLFPHVYRLLRIPQPPRRFGAYFYTIQDGKVTIEGYIDDVEKLAIPEEIDGMPVTGIGRRAFSDRFHLAAIAMPETITDIGEEAFSACRELSSITIPASVDNIGEGVFANCNSLTEIVSESETFSVVQGVLIDNKRKTLLAYPAARQGRTYAMPEGITAIGAYAFSRSTLERITLPKTVSRIGRCAFYHCGELTGINIPDGVAAIANRAFYACSKLSGLALPDSVISIGDSAFTDCDALTTITIPKNVTNIGNQAFYFCDSLTDIFADSTAYTSIDGVLFDIARNTLHTYPAGKDDKTYAIPEGFAKIGDNAFGGNEHLLSVTIPDTVDTIGRSAFAYCTNLTQAILPANISSISSHTFTRCLKLTDVIIPAGVTTINASSFWGCEALTYLAIPDSVTSIGANAFERCENLMLDVSTDYLKQYAKDNGIPTKNAME